MFEFCAVKELIPALLRQAGFVSNKAPKERMQRFATQDGVF
jgi:hypothetical protein